MRFVLQVHITSACDSRCAHCYQRDAKPAHMALADFKLLMNQMDELEAELEKLRGSKPSVLVTVTGGEPLLHPQFRQIVLEVWRHGFDLAVLTNGHLMDVSTAVLLRNAAFVQVSLDGDEKTHDAIRGEGDFKQVIAGIRTLKDARANPIVSFTAHAQNYRTLPAAVEEARKAGANRFWSDRYLPMGDCPSLDPLDASQTAEYLQLLGQASKKRGGIVMRHRALQFLCGGIPYACHAGSDILAVAEDGQVYPCRRLPLLCGDFRKVPLVRIYTSDPTVVLLREAGLPSECGSCNHADVCGGGLRCMSEAVAGDWHVADPGCPLRPGADVALAGNAQIVASAPPSKGLKRIKRRAPRFRSFARVARSLKRAFGGRHE